MHNKVLVAKWLTLRFAKPTCAGSNPAQDSNSLSGYTNVGMVELVDTQHLNCCEATRAGSIPAPDTFYNFGAGGIAVTGFLFF